MTTSEIFGRNLRDMLEKKHKTQRALAKHAGVTETTVSRWANGEAVAKSNRMDLICQFLNCTPAELMGSRDTVPQESPELITGQEIWDRPILLKLFFKANVSDDEDIKKCIEYLEKRRKLKHGK